MDEDRCEHQWRVAAREEVVSIYSPIDPSEEYLELDYSETTRVLEILSARCGECGEDAPPETVERLRRSLPDH